MRIYVAGRTNNIEGVRQVQKACTTIGHSITHDWTRIVEQVGGAAKEDTVSIEDQRRYAEWDAAGVHIAQLLIMVCSTGLCGTLIEFGMALAQNKPVWIFGDPERHSVFFHLDNVLKVNTLSGLNRSLLLLPR